MSCVGWAVNVNKIIIDSTTVTIGDGAVVKDGLESGGKSKSRLACANPPDKFSVEMSFNWLEHDDDGLTEKDRFFKWYKYVLKYSTNSFYFPSILLNSNKSTGQDTEQISYGKSTSYEWYRITSAVEGSKSGNDILVKMTWETDAQGYIEIPTDTATIDHMECYNGQINAVFNSTPTTSPTPNDFALKINGFSVTDKIVVFDDDLTAAIYFAEEYTAGTYTVSLTFGSTTLSGTFVLSSDVSRISYTQVSNGTAVAVLTSCPLTTPTASDFSMTVAGAAETINSITYDGDKTVTIYFTAKTVAGTYSVNVTYGGSTSSASFTI